MSDEPTPEENAAHEALCGQIDHLVRQPGVSYDNALLALTCVLAQLCTETDYEAEVCLNVCEDLLVEFRRIMEERPTETIIPIPDPN